MSKTWATLAGLTRPDAAFLFFLSVCLPLLTRTGELTYSLRASVPVLLIFICIYLLDHVEDVEGDQINHPNRPLPSGQIGVPAVVVTYFLFLFAALVATRLYAPSGAYLYYALLILGINYNQVAEHLPNVKSLYVALVSTAPLLILREHSPDDPNLNFPIISMFVFTLGKELCMDFRDREGDPKSFVHRLTPQSLGSVAFSLQGAGLLLLAFLVHTLVDATVLIILGLLFIPTIRLWLAFEDYRKAIGMMKLQLVGGLYFLL